MFRSCQIITRELCCSLLKLYYNIHNLIRFCKQGVVAACCVGMCCRESSWLGMRRCYRDASLGLRATVAIR